MTCRGGLISLFSNDKGNSSYLYHRKKKEPVYFANGAHLPCYAVCSKVNMSFFIALFPIRYLASYHQYFQ